MVSTWGTLGEVRPTGVNSKVNCSLNTNGSTIASLAGASQDQLELVFC